jgi:O-antigen/teichoic acid export membrane protein
MSLEKNIVANYASQIYVTLIGIVIVPLYIKYMGAEAYGLLGFFTTLQAWFNLLDIGLTPTVARETARFRGGAADALSFRCLVRTLEGVFLIVAVAGGSALFAASGYIAQDWLHASQLALAEVQTAVQLMAMVIAMRLMCGLYRGAISGSERLVWLSGFNSIVATLRFAGVLPLLMFVGATPAIFFGFQLAVAVLELALLVFYAYRLLPGIPRGWWLLWNWVKLKPVIKFSLTIAFTSTLWVLVTQTDKLILSNRLLLSEYAYFALAVLVASGVLAVAAPISGALLPRMTKMNAEGNETGLIRVYRNATQLVAIISISAALMLAFFAEKVLWAWTGDGEIVIRVSPLLKLYALGNGISAIGTLCFYLQFAKGDLRLHLLETPLFLAVFLPSLLWLTRAYGSLGAGYAWAGTQILFFALWVPLVHRRLAKGLHIRWLMHDVSVPFGLSLCTVALGYVLVDSVTGWPAERSFTALLILLLGMITIAVTAMSSRLVRAAIQRQWSLHASPRQY